MDIADVATATGLTPSTIRYYEQQGLIQSCARKGLRRQFDDTIIERLAFIKLAKRADFTLAQIKHMVTPHAITVDRVLLREKAHELDEKIHQLMAIRDGLEHVAACTAKSHFECPKFLSILHAN